MINSAYLYKNNNSAFTNFLKNLVKIKINTISPKLIQTKHASNSIKDFASNQFGA